MTTADKIEGAPLIAPSTTDHPLYDSVVEIALAEAPCSLRNRSSAVSV